MNKKTVLIAVRRRDLAMQPPGWGVFESYSQRRLHNENNNDERRDQDDHDALHR